MPAINTKGGVRKVIFEDTITFTADIPKYRFVNYAGGLCTSSQVSIGVSRYDFKNGDTGTIDRIGTVLVELEETVALGEELSAGTDGKAKIATDGDKISGYAREAGDAGDIIRVDIALVHSNGISEPRWEKFTITYADQGTTVDLITLSAGTIVTNALAVVTQIFNGTTPTITVGDAGDPDGYLESADVILTTLGAYGETQTSLGLYLATSPGGVVKKKYYSTATTIQAVVGGTGATTGSVTILLNVANT